MSAADQRQARLVDPLDRPGVALVHLPSRLHPRHPPHNPPFHGPANNLCHCQQKGAQAEGWWCIVPFIFLQ